MSHRRDISVYNLIIFILILASSAAAEAPKIMSYQGRATDASGNPVTDGNHTVRFDLFSSATTGSSLWNEQTSVTTSGGLFTHLLGSVTPMIDHVFRGYEGLWLQVTFDGEIQTPRTQFTSVGYAYHVQSIHNADGGTIKNGLAIYDPYTDNEIAGMMADGAGSSQLWLRGGDVDQSYYNVNLDAADNSLEFIDKSSGNDTTTYALRKIKLADGVLEVDGTGIDMNGELYINGSTDVYINANSTGNGSVYLPDGAIGKREIVDEPGIALNTEPGQGVLLTYTAFTDIVTTSITIPASGYVVLFGKTYFGVVETSAPGSAEIAYQIDTTSGGAITDKTSSYVQSKHYYYYGGTMTGSTHQVYYLNVPGTYTFRLEGLYLNASSARAYYSSLLAIYIPASYGSVSTLVSGSEAGIFESAEQLTDSDGSRLYKVDLRELELKAARAEAEVERARADAEKAQRELLRAKYESLNDQSDQ
ncbi:MAG: hypothetical protein AB1746_02545 [Candidatus Zixiibacteriota bacterium]